MRNLIATAMVLVSMLCGNVYAQKVAPANENVELMGVLAHVAGYREYNENRAGQYDVDIDTYFKKYADHPAVLFMKELRQKPKEELKIAYDAVMSMALHLQKDSNGQFSLADTTDVSSLERRWKVVDKSKFCSLLSQFYKDTDFHRFFTAHKSFYQSFIQKTTKFFSQLSAKDKEFYTNTLWIGKDDEFTVITMFCGGTNNFVVRRHLKGKNEEVFFVQGYQDLKK